MDEFTKMQLGGIMGLLKFVEIEDKGERTVSLYELNDELHDAFHAKYDAKGWTFSEKDYLRSASYQEKMRGMDKNWPRYVATLELKAAQKNVLIQEFCE